MNATSAGNTILWYTVPTNGTPIGSSASGANFAVTPASTTTYYAEANIAAGNLSQTYNYTGSNQVFTVPAGVYMLTIDAYGAEGIGKNGYTPGQGGRARGELAVVPGQVLNVYVGGQSLFNGGGSGRGGANGGDASDVRLGGTALSDRIIVAAGGGGAGGDNWGCNSGNGDGGGGTAGANFVGGGGGSGYGFCGGNGGNTGGSSGSNYHGGGGGGGGLTSGGAGANATASSAASPGTLGFGGASNNSASCGATGGGGGGYYGGGGAAGTNCGAGQGGGGSSWTGTLNNPYFQAGVRNSNGQVTISWFAPAPNCPLADRTPVTVTVDVLPPTVTTTAASLISGISATLNGTVNANNTASDVSFEYGLTTAYGTTVSGIPASVSGITPQSVSAFISGLALNTTYHYRVVATNSAGTSLGNDMTFTTLISTFCIPAYTYGCNSGNMGITYFGLNSISQNIACSGTPSYYHDFTSSSTNLGLNGTYSIAVQSTGSYSSYIRVWIDYNHNNVFDGDAEVAGQGYFGSGTSFTFPITVSASALTGSARLRIMTRSYNSGYPTDPCSTSEYYGNCNDFTVNIVPQGAPLVSTMPATSISGVGATLNGFVNPNGFSSSVSFEYGLDASYGTTVAAIPSSLTGSTNAAVKATLLGLSMNTTYHYRVISTSSEGTTLGNDMIFTTLITPYCIPAYSLGCTYNMGLTNFQLVTINQPISCTGTPNYYHDFTSDTAAIYQNGIYSISVTCGYYYNYVTVWIDYNHNNLFDGASEVVGQVYCSNPGSVYNIPFTVSVSSLTGLTRLRAMVSYNNYPTDPCSLTGEYGNCSDFTVNVFAPLTPPTVTTTAASGITGTSGEMNGTINANGTPTNITFNWGTSVSYGNNIAGVPASVTGSTDTPVTASLTGLTPNSTYHYRAAASGISGAVNGGDRTLVTSTIPPTVVTGTASYIYSTNVRLSGTVNANNATSSVSFEYGLTTGYGSSIAGSPSSVSGYSVQNITGNLTGLTLNTVYHYRIKSTNSAGTSYGDDMTFTSSPNLYCIPSYSTGCNTYNMGLSYFGLNTISQSITCTGAPSFYHNFYPTSTDLNKTGTYTVSVTTPSGYGQNVVVWIDNNKNNVFDGASEVAGQGHVNAYSSSTFPITISASATIGTTWLRVMANYDYYGYPTDPCGSYYYGNCSDFMVNILPALVPPTVTTTAASGVAATLATLNGIVNANDYSTNVTFNYGLTASYGTTVSGVPSPVTGTTDVAVSASLTGLSPNTTYHYRVSGTGIGGTSLGNDMTFTTDMIPPTVVTTAATGIAGVSAYLNGTVNPNNLTSSVSFEYGLTATYGSTVVGTPSGLTGYSVQSSTAFISGLTMNTVYHYRIVSTNSAGTSYGDDMTVQTLPTLFCIPYFSDGCNAPWYMGLSYIELNTIAQSISCTGSPSYYHDFTSSMTDLAQNGNYTMSIQNASGYGLYVNVWIDYNHNNYFDGASEVAGQGHINSSTSSTIALTISGTSLTGEARIRVMAVYDYYGYPTPCGSYNYGNCSDFTVNIHAPGPPIVSTTAATLVNVSSATIHGLVNPNYFSSSVSFEYGLTAAYGSTIAGTPSPLTGGTNTAVSAALAGLTINTTYHYRVSSTNSSGTSVGDDMTFTTTPTTIYNVTGGGSYCTNGTGLSVGLSGSDFNTSYQLYKNALASGSPVAGTGSPLSWDNQTVGTYTVEAMAALGNPIFMNGSAVITSFNNPVSVSIGANYYTICPGTPVTFTAYPSNGGTAPIYKWIVNGDTVGTNSYQYAYVPNHGDHIKCLMISNIACPSGNPALSNTITITVSAPVPTITGSPTACLGSIGNAYSTESGKTNYVWNVSAGGTITLGGNGYYFINVTWNTAGAQTVSVNYSNNDGCNAVSPTVKNITVNTVPTPTITGPATACTGSTGNVYTTEPGMASYAWSVTGGTVTAGSGTNQITVSWNASGAQTVSVNYSNGCTAITPTVYNVAVNPIPAPTVTGPISVCVNSTGNVYTTEAGMNTYNWTVSAGGTITSGGSPTDNTITVSWNTTGNKTVQVNYANSFGCTVANPGIANVTVYPIPVPSLTGLSTICDFPSAGNTYTTEAGMSNYVWLVSAGGTITSGGTATDNTVTVTWNASGNQSVRVNYSSAGGCTPQAASILNVAVYPLPLVEITGSNIICQGDTAIFTAATLGAGLNPEIQWFVNGNPAASAFCGGGLQSGLIASYPFNGNVNDESGSGHNGIAYGNPTLIPDRFGNPNKAYSFDGINDYIDLGSWFTYNKFSISFWANQHALTGDYTDIIDNNHSSYQNWVIQSPNSLDYGFGIAYVGSAGFSLITDQWKHVVCIKDSLSMKTYVNGELKQSVASGYAPNYSNPHLYVSKWGGGNRHFNGKLDDIRFYNRALCESEVLSLFNGNDSTFRYVPANGDIVTCVVTSSAGCSGISNAINMSVLPAPTPSLSGPDSVCQNSTGNVYTTEAGKTNYSWIVSAGGSITGGGSLYDNSITVSWTGLGSQSVQVNYSNSNACNAASAASFNVTVNPLPVPAITGPASVCAGSTGNVYTTAAGMSNYAWTVSAGGTITAGGTSSDNSVTVTWNNAEPGTVSVNYTDNSGCQAANPTTKNISVYSIPSPAITGTTNVCAGGSGIVYTTEPGKSNYSWVISAGGAITSGGGAGNNTVTVLWNTTGAQTVSVNYNNAAGCPAPAPFILDVTVYSRPVPTLNGPTPVCAGSVENIYNTEPGMTNYSWSVSGGTISAGGTSSSSFVSVIWNSAGARTVSVNYQNASGCSALTATIFNVTVNPRPVPTITGPGSICGIPSAGNVYTTEAGMTAYTWIVSAGGSITAGGTATDNSVSVTWTTSGAKTVSVAYTNGNGCHPANPTVKNVNVEVIPVPAITGPALVCGIPSTGNVYTTESGKSAYTWTVSAGGTITSVAGSRAITVTWSSSGQQEVTVNYLSNIGCAPLAPTTYFVNVFPFVASTISGPTGMCGIPSTGNIYSTVGGMTGYTWAVSYGGTITAGQGTDSITVSWTTAGAKTVTVTYFDGNGCSPASPIVKNVNVYALPVPVITGNAAICDVPSAGNVYTTEAGMTGYVWTVSAGGTITAGGTSNNNSITVTWTALGNQTVSVSYTDTHGCTAASPTVKNVGVYLYVPVSLSISTNENPTCSGNYVTYMATPYNGGASPSYQWKVNGLNAGWNSSSFWYAPLNNDVVTCIMTSSLPCTTGSPAQSNAITMTVNGHPDAPVSRGNLTVCSTTLPALLAADAPAGSVVDWYNYPSGGSLLLAGSSVYSTSVAGTYYAESRSLTTGCRSTSRVAVSLTVNTAIVYYIDHDGDGYGNPEVFVLACVQPGGYVTNGLDCNDNDPNINPGAQHLAYTGNTGFTSSIVSPEVGSSYTIFHFEADYFDATNSLPPAGYPRLILDYEGNGNYTDANDRVIIMTESDPTDLTTSNGKRYFAEVTGLAYGTNWKSRVIVSGDAGCLTSFGPFDYPDVLHEPNIYLFANDISFSEPHPTVSQNITVSAVVHNESDFAAQNFVCHMVNQWDTTIVYPDITVANLPAHQT
ncbi:MAG: GEVED domain-containing protein, partial [Bacteroidota bacterium]